MTTTLLAPRPAGTARPDPPPRVRRMRYEPEPGSRALNPPAPPPPPLPAVPPIAEPAAEGVRHAVGGAVRLAMEVLDGRRPPAQLRHHFDAAALRYWRAAAHQRQVRAPARVVRMRLCLPRPGAVEVTAVCDIDGRVRALAARFEQAAPAARWLCTAVRLG